MADIVSKHVRSEIMRRIRAEDTKPEITLRTGLHFLGHRYRLKTRIGVPRPDGKKEKKIKPDLVLRKWNCAIFVHGCFWHQHRNCYFAYIPKSNMQFWVNKFAANRKRDLVVDEELRRAGWRVLVVWECILERQESAAAAIIEAHRWVLSKKKVGLIPLQPTRVRPRKRK